MQPYLIEGLDCSGKKTTATLVERHFARTASPVRCIIGPLVPSPLRILDEHLTHIRKKIHRGEILDLLRRGVYLAGPIIDGVFFHQSAHWTLIKISSHYRAQSRAIIENDSWMAKWFERTKAWCITYGGCTCLTTSFHSRIERHRQDVAAGRFAKLEAVRFLNYSEETFQQWDETLWQLLVLNIPFVQRIDTEFTSPEDVVQKVIRHIELCRRQGVIL